METKEIKEVKEVKKETKPKVCETCHGNGLTKIRYERSRFNTRIEIAEKINCPKCGA